MESNKDEAIHCVEIAEKFIDQKNLGRAQKFLRKSLKLYPSEKAENLLVAIQDLPHFHTACQSIEPAKKKSAKKACRRQTPHKLKETIDYILKTNDYYDLLRVSKNASEKEIKKSYKKLALMLHPDKTQQRGAAEAFKAIRNAVAILTDPTKKKLYDAYGTVETNASASCYSFNSTFNGRRDSESSGTDSDRTTLEDDAGLYGKPTKRDTFILKVLWPIIFAVVLTCVTTFFLHDPMYSFQKSPRYPVLRYTHNLKIPYYVKENFLMENSGLTITQLDNEVEVETITNLQYACYNERSYSKCLSLLWYNLHGVHR